MSCQTFEVVCCEFGFAFELGDQATIIFFTPSLLGAVVVEVELAFSFVVDDIRLTLHKLLQFLLVRSNGEGSVIDDFNAEDDVRVNCCDPGYFGDLLCAELSHREHQPNGISPFLA